MCGNVRLCRLEGGFAGRHPPIPATVSSPFMFPPSYRRCFDEREKEREREREREREKKKRERELERDATELLWGTKGHLGQNGFKRNRFTASDSSW